MYFTHPCCRVPHPHPDGLFAGLIPETSDRNECRTDGAFDEAEEEALGDESGVVGAHYREDTDDAPNSDDHCAGGWKGQAGKEEGEGEDGDDVAPVELPGQPRIRSIGCHDACRLAAPCR